MRAGRWRESEHGGVGVVKWSAWKSVLAGAVIGFVEAAGPAAARRRLHRPLAMIRIDDRRTPDPLRGLGVWFIDPLPNPRPAPTDRRGGGGPLRLARFLPMRRGLPTLWPSGS